MRKNHPKIYTKPQNIGECFKWKGLALLETQMLETGTRYWHKGHVERRENSLQVKSRLNLWQTLNTSRKRTGLFLLFPLFSFWHSLTDKKD